MTMTHRDRAMAVLHYQPVDRLPLVHFGFLHETRQVWHRQGRISKEELDGASDGSPIEAGMASKLGFDFNWQNMFYTSTSLRPYFETVVVATFPDGTQHVRNGIGAVSVAKPGGGSIHAEVDHLLKDRASWEEHFKPRLRWTPERVTESTVWKDGRQVRFDQGGLEHLRAGRRETPLGLHCGSLYGDIRNMLGMENACFLLADDEDLFTEIVDTIADLSYQNVRFALESGARFDFAHFWEDICFKNGPLINPRILAEKMGPHYRRITDLAKRHGIDIVSLDCDGWIDALVPVWFENGVNTMFPIEVGTWDATLAPWRRQHGKELRGVGGMNKRAFSRDRKAMDEEIERLRPLIELGGYIPCPDHRIPEDCHYDMVRYYCEEMHRIYG